jgi:murein DD-endopeptidase MepM/ murein hydrolase activator NlpD
MNSHRKTLFIQGKIALLIALGLSLVVALDLYRDRVAAREVETVPSQIEQIDILKSEPRSTPSSDSMLTLSPEQEGNYPSAMAIEAQPKASGSEPAVSQADAGELAAAVWAGASFPVENFQTYTSPFGYRRAPDGGYRQEFHYGLDMAAPNGSYIRISTVTCEVMWRARMDNAIWLIAMQVFKFGKVSKLWLGLASVE